MEIELARLAALSALALPAVVYVLRLRKTNPGIALRYVAGIIGMMLWAGLGVALTVSAVPNDNRFTAAVAIAFLLSWISVAIVGFVAWCSPLDIANKLRPIRLRRIAAVSAIVTAALAAVLLALTRG